MIRSIRHLPHHDLTLLSPAERVELVELRQDFADNPDLASLSRLNVLQGRATRREWFDLVRLLRRKSPTGGGRQ